jgi:predicted kinase
MIVLMAGLPATGKTTLACELAARVRGAILSKDAIRAASFAPADIEYSVQQDDFVMEIMLDAARFLLQKDAARTIFLDGRTFSRGYQIDRVLSFAAELAHPWMIIECVCSDQSARQRLESDQSHPARNWSFELYQEVQSHFEPITYLKAVIDTDLPLDHCVEQALAAMTQRG